VTEHTPEPVYEPQRPRRRERRPGWRKAGRALFIGILSLLGFLVLAIVAAVVWLRTGTGTEELGRFVAHEASLANQGDLRVRQLEVGGFLHLCVDGVELRDPDGHKVASAERVCVRLQPLALKAHRVALKDVDLQKPWIEIAKVPGSNETTLSRAIASRVKSAAPGGPFQWVIDVQSLALRSGTVTVRPELGKPATVALTDLDVSQAHAHYALANAAAALQLTALLAAPGKAAVSLDLDATVAGAVTTGNVSLRTLRLKLGESGVSASGSWDIARQSGAIALRDLVVTPADVEALTHSKELAGTVRGQADVRSDGKTGQVDLRLDGGGGRLQAKVTATL
jgi:uncharacterized protein involved in outer membrane biogenesis